MCELRYASKSPSVVFSGKSISKGSYSRGQRRLHVLALARVHEGGQALETVAGETEQVDDLEQVWRHHGDAQVEEAVAEADGALEPVQGLGRDAVLHWRVVVGVVRGEGLLVGRGPPLAGLLQLADVTVALVVHFPRLTQNPASFDISCYLIRRYEIFMTNESVWGCF